MVQECSNKNFFPVYRKFLIFLEKDHIGKLESAKNKMGNYFENPLDNYTKKMYRSFKGIFDYIMARKDGRIENQKKVQTN